MHKFLNILGAVLVALNVQFLLLTVRTTDGTPIAHNVWTAIIGIAVGVVFGIVAAVMVAMPTTPSNG